MKKIPIFDCLTHPMPSNTWLDSRFNHRVSAESLIKEMRASNVTRAFAVGMGPEIGGYKEESYASWVRSNIPNTYPVAYCSPNNLQQHSLYRYMQRLKELGYYGIKLNPRLGKFVYDNPILPAIIYEANNANLLIMICSYCYGHDMNTCQMGIESMINLIRACDSESRIIILHGGVTKLLEVSEEIRSFKNIIMDLSYTIQRFVGSSLEYDIQYLFNNFDHHLCIGSDHPQYTLSFTRKRFEKLADGIPEEKLSNIAYLNLDRLLKG